MLETNALHGNTPRQSWGRSGPATPAIPATASTSTSTRSAGPAVTATGASPVPRIDMGDKQPYYPQPPPSAPRPTPPTSSTSSTKPSTPASTTPSRPSSAPPSTPSSSATGGSRASSGSRPSPATSTTTTAASSSSACAEYLDRYPRAGFIAMPEGSWGAEGDNHVWMNPETSWTYTHIYPAELYTRDVCTAGQLAQHSPRRAHRQAALPRASPPRILRLAVPHHHRSRPRLRRDPLPHSQRSVQRSQSHLADLESTGAITAAQETRLAEIERRDNVFPDIDPGLWVSRRQTSPPRKLPTTPAKEAHA